MLDVFRLPADHRVPGSILELEHAVLHPAKRSSIRHAIRARSRPCSGREVTTTRVVESTRRSHVRTYAEGDAFEKSVSPPLHAQHREHLKKRSVIETRTDHERANLREVRPRFDSRSTCSPASV